MGSPPVAAGSVVEAWRRDGLWIGTAFCAAAGLAAGVLTLFGTGDQGTRLALQATARLAFVPFWMAYVGNALVALCGRSFEPWQRRAREFGLAFAAVLTVHLALVAWLCAIGEPPSARTFLIFGFAALGVYAMALFSIGRWQTILGARQWHWLRVVGMNYAAFAFALDFLRNPFGGGIRHAAAYWPFAVLAVLGPVLRLAAVSVRRKRRVMARG